MGLPSIEIIFKTLGITAIKRSSRGVVVLILEDAAHATVENPIIMRGVNDIPDTLSEDNQEQIELTFRGGVNPPKRVMAYVIAPGTELDPTDYTDAQNYLETAQWDYLAVPQIAADKVDSMATWIKGLRDNKAIRVRRPTGLQCTKALSTSRPTASRSALRPIQQRSIARGSRAFWPAIH